MDSRTRVREAKNPTGAGRWCLRNRPCIGCLLTFVPYGRHAAYRQRDAPPNTVDGKDCPILNGLFRVNDLLQDFASFAWATSKHCAAARAKLMEKSAYDGEWEARFPSALARTMRHDMSNLVSGHFSGETFTSVQLAAGLPLWLINVAEARGEEFDVNEWRGKFGVPYRAVAESPEAR